ncbi:hypothetical protein CPB84DRAFT_1792442 [Gymnopilus junonius]|uniref:Uncharacterized protein n=1 Tax=Gymnopilus junonius TaxID=109634 RepID=A0A9P5NCK6_GYMJU|nr:hypothetical protein CPB84DRAFT_1792442 [Gymnopilus junonius]
MSDYRFRPGHRDLTFHLLKHKTCQMILSRERRMGTIVVLEDSGGFKEGGKASSEFVTIWPRLPESTVQILRSPIPHASDVGVSFLHLFLVGIAQILLVSWCLSGRHGPFFLLLSDDLPLPTSLFERCHLLCAFRYRLLIQLFDPSPMPNWFICHYKGPAQVFLIFIGL